ncbi:hypothetical protein KIN20_019482 [Parelaphostrongylus tenuis]|uniref:Uncharacterized protein n=1 Tax=Parelaphostrongylus tenuis TaxID=148309 RepID=A0AAD5QSF9_PARTN|nr:hypothetical protein KIN20_019482 [Parelaphostrongylus tenuis]
MRLHLSSAVHVAQQHRDLCCATFLALLDSIGYYQQSPINGTDSGPHNMALNIEEAESWLKLRFDSYLLFSPVSNGKVRCDVFRENAETRADVCAANSKSDYIFSGQRVLEARQGSRFAIVLVVL